MNIYIKDIIGNLMIEVNKLNGSRTVSNRLINLYMEEIICNLYQREVDHHLVLNEKSVLEFESNYSDFFTSYEDGTDTGYILNKDKEVEDLEVVFRSKLDSDLVEAFTNLDVIKNGIVKYFCPKYPNLYQECCKYPEIQLHTELEKDTVKQKQKKKMGF